MRHDRNTNGRMLSLHRWVFARGKFGVRAGLQGCRAIAALALTAALCGCANLDLDANQGWFAKPLDVLGNKGGYTFSELQESQKERPITASDLVDANGGCAPIPAPAQSSRAAGPGVIPSPPPEAPSMLGEGIALGMSECDVVYRAGTPSSARLGKNPDGRRTAVLTFNAGPRPGVYRFEAGRLMEMDRAAEAPTEPKVVKKKPVKRQQAAN